MSGCVALLFEHCRKTSPLHVPSQKCRCNACCDVFAICCLDTRLQICRCKEVLHWFLSRREIMADAQAFEGRLCHAAASMNSLPILKFLVDDQDCEINAATIKKAAVVANDDLLRYLVIKWELCREDGCFITIPKRCPDSRLMLLSKWVDTFQSNGEGRNVQRPSAAMLLLPFIFSLHFQPATITQANDLSSCHYLLCIDWFEQHPIGTSTIRTLGVFIWDPCTAGSCTSIQNEWIALMLILQISTKGSRTLRNQYINKSC